MPGDSILEFETVGSGAKTWHLTADKLAHWELLFPDLDVLVSCKKARAWLIENPARRKTAKHMGTFLLGWLGRTQNRGGDRRAAGSVKRCEWHGRAGPSMRSRYPKDWCPDCRHHSAAAGDRSGEPSTPSSALPSWMGEMSKKWG